MKKILLLLTLLFTITTSAQYAIVSAVDLNEGAEDDYIKTEKFWGPLHKKAIEDGVQTQQAVWKVIQTSDDRENPADYFIITSFASKEQLANYSSADYGKYAQEAYKGKMSKELLQECSMLLQTQVIKGETIILKVFHGLYLQVET